MTNNDNKSQAQKDYDRAAGSNHQTPPHNPPTPQDAPDPFVTLLIVGAYVGGLALLFWIIINLF